MKTPSIQSRYEPNLAKQYSVDKEINEAAFVRDRIVK